MNGDSQVTKRIIEEWLSGWNRKNLDLIMSHYADDATFTSPVVLLFYPDRVGGTVKGKEAIRKLNESALARLPDLHFEIVHAVAGDEVAIVEYRRRGIVPGKEMLAVEVFEVQQGKIQRDIVYWHAEEVACRFTPKQFSA